MDLKTNPYKKVCKFRFCNKPFDAKRTNQEFCCKDHYIKHNNLIAKEVRDITKDIDAERHRNRKILKLLARKENVTYNELKKLGFKINSCTNFKKVENSMKNVLFYYDYSLEQIDSETYKINIHE